MKSNPVPPIQAEPGQNISNPASPQPGGTRTSITKAVEHRYERRKIREKLRRLDSVPDVEDLIFA